MATGSAEEYIVRQPIHNADRELVAYEVMYVEGDDAPWKNIPKTLKQRTLLSLCSSPSATTVCWKKRMC